MAINKAEGIILHGRKQGETSKILTLYTREFGKISAMAKGSRGTRSKYLGALETFNYVSLVFYRKEGRDMQYLSDASIIEPFSSIHSTLGKMALAAVPCEIVDKSEEDDHSHPEQFQLLLSTLKALEKNKTGLRNIIRAFQLQFISMAGFEPMLNQCHFCDKTEPDDINFFSIEHGLYSCNHCGHLKESAKKVSGYVIELLRWFQSAPIQKAAQAKVPRAVGVQIDTILIAYLQSHIDTLYNLKSIEHLKKLELNLSNG
jgi:DNA repair protein RecO (recombination protein O)